MDTDVMPVAVAAIFLTVCIVVSGCAADRPQTSSDCQAQVRTDGRVYTSYGYAQRKASRHAVADRADCHDVGDDSAGSVFLEHPEQVTTWSFDGYPPEEVLGVRVDKDSFAVFISDSLSDTERERIVQTFDQQPSS